MKAKAQAISCVGNLKQLQLGWHLYVDDYNDLLPPNIEAPDVPSMLRNISNSWVVGNAQTDTTTSNIQSGVLFQYVNSVEVYRCPSDRSTVKNSAKLRRTRSYTLSSWLNADATRLPGLENEKAGSDPFIKSKAGQINQPAQIFTFLDEHEQSIDDGAMVVDNPLRDPQDQDNWFDLPSDRHQQGSSISFADGHVVSWRWKWPKKFTSHLQPAASSAQDPQGNDLRDLRQLEAWIPHDP